MRRLLVPFLCLFAVWLGGGEILRFRFERRLAELRESGVPIEPEDIMRPPVAPGRNAAPQLREFARMSEAAGTPKALYTDEASWTPEIRAGLAKWVDHLEPGLRLLKEAAGKPECDFGVDWRDGGRTELQSIPTLAQAVQFLDLRARHRSGADGIESAAVLMDLARRYERWTVLNVVVRWTVEGAAAYALQKLARRPGFDAAAARRTLDARFAAAEAAVPASVRDAFHGERIMMVIHIRQWINGLSPRSLGAVDGGGRGVYDLPRSLAWVEEDERSVYDLFLGSWLARPFACRDGLAYLDLMDEVLPLLEREPRLAAPELERIARSAEDDGLLVVFRSLGATLPFNVNKQRQRHLATLRQARIALALLEVKQETGAWPATLAGVAPRLGGAAPLDPYTGKPFAYEPGVKLEAAAPIPDPGLRDEYEVVWRFK